MIKDPLGIVLVLLLIEGLVLFLSGHPRFRRYFRFLPHVFWIYFLPMLVSASGLLYSQSAVYAVITKYLLPASLFLLLLSVDLKMIARLGPSALGMFFAGSLGIMLGTVLVFMMMRGIVGDEFASGFAALSGSWMGGSANMVAVKEALRTPDSVFLPMVIVDTIVPYFWMGILVALSTGQNFFDRWNRSQKGLLDEISLRLGSVTSGPVRALGAVPAAGLVLLGIAVSFGILTVGRSLPTMGGMFSPFTWAIILASLLGLAGSLTPLRKLEQAGSNKIGYFLLYFVLTTIGARASLEHLGNSGILILAGFGIVAIHAAVLIVAARLLKAPMFLAAVASQANIGGTASAPIVAEIYRPGLAAVGLLMAVLGSVVGTYLGLLVGKICFLIIGN
jgi:uncharacterized membrane protein